MSIINLQTSYIKHLYIIFTIYINIYTTSEKCILRSEIDKRLSYEANNIDANKAILIIVTKKSNLKLDDIPTYDNIVLQVKTYYRIDDVIRICERRDKHSIDDSRSNGNEMYLVYNKKIIKKKIFNILSLNDVYEFLDEYNMNSNDNYMSIDKNKKNSKYNDKREDTINDNINNDLCEWNDKRDKYMFLQKSSYTIKRLYDNKSYIIVIMIIYFISFMVLLVICRFIIKFAVTSNEELIKLKSIKAKRLIKNVQRRFMYYKPIY